MATETDIRLRSWLNTNQREREQMCRSVLALDKHYTDVRPRHPSGGRDGGRDIEAIFQCERVAFGAVGFANDANDSSEQKKSIRGKFTSDLNSALKAKPDLKIFVFLTNIHLTMGEQLEMKNSAHTRGIEHCDIIDRERLRIELDSPSGFFIRFQHLNIPLSEAEQASFLARYGDRIQEIVSTGFERVERTLNRVLFILESADVLEGMYVRFHLKQAYRAEEIGHFRAFVDIFLRAAKQDILSVVFGSADKVWRFTPERNGNDDSVPGIGAAISSGQWEQQLSPPDPIGDKKEGFDEHGNDLGGEPPEDKLTFVGNGSGIGLDPVPSITVRYTHDDPLIRFRPRLELRDLNDCMFMPVLNLTLAEKLHSIEVFANGYKLADIGPEDFLIDREDFSLPLSEYFSPEELRDPWVRIRPSSLASTFHLGFTSQTPRRMFEHTEMRKNPPE